MSEAGWYPDYEDPSRLRYHDGTAWTEHLHVGESQGAGIDAGAVAVSDGSPGDVAVETTPSGDAKKESLGVQLASFAFIGLLVGFMLGAFLFNGVGAITPLTETTGTVNRIELDYNSSSTTGTSTRVNYLLVGTTAEGDDWRIVDEDAYRVLEAEGYPQPVELAIGDWTGTPERVIGATWKVDHQTTGARIGWGAVIGFIALAGIGATVLIAKFNSHGIPVALAFVIFFFGPGNWIGYQAVQWIQSA